VTSLEDEEWVLATSYGRRLSASCIAGLDCEECQVPTRRANPTSSSNYCTSPDRLLRIFLSLTVSGHPKINEPKLLTLAVFVTTSVAGAEDTRGSPALNFKSMEMPLCLLGPSLATCRDSELPKQCGMRCCRLQMVALA